MSEQPNLRGMTRDELNAHAGELGMADAAEYPNKDALIEAIEALPPVPAEDVQGDEDGEESEDGDEVAPEGTRYRVLKAITLADGRTVMPGEEFVPDADFPSRRPKQLVEQKFLRPIE